MQPYRSQCEQLAGEPKSQHSAPAKVPTCQACPGAAAGCTYQWVTTGVPRLSSHQAMVCIDHGKHCSRAQPPLTCRQAAVHGHFYRHTTANNDAHGCSDHCACAAACALLVVPQHTALRRLWQTASHVCGGYCVCAGARCCQQVPKSQSRAPAKLWTLS
jgi:hypothetical protein